jgi:hypothetical protein
VPAGADLNGTVGIVGGVLGTGAAAGGKLAAGGSFDAQLKFAGKGASPRGIASVLQGSGSLELSEAKLATLWPGAVGLAIEAALKSDADKLRATVSQGLASALAGGQVPLPAKVALEIADGQVRTQPLVIDTADGRASGGATLDLRSLQVDSEWRLEQAPAAATPGKGALPPVSVGYRGALAALPSLEPRINSDALERELAVRKMERDVEELERLRKLDEARRRSEAERLRQQLDRAPAPAPLPAAPGRPATPG